MSLPEGRQYDRVLVTGGAGFIGSALVRRLVGLGVEVLNLDKLTYAGSLSSLASVSDAPNYRFERGDIAESARIAGLIADFGPQAIVNLAAESHVDRSIDAPAAFIDTNVVGTSRLLDCALAFWQALAPAEQANFRLLHVSTDEVFGSLPLDRSARFSETSSYNPTSPYSASKAASDHLVRAWHATYGLPILISTCSNNYGPYQHAEKLIPLTILNAIEGLPLPIYGNGKNVRDWLHVDDHVSALLAMLTDGRAGKTYAIGGGEERTNCEVVEAICDLVDARKPGRRSRDLIRFVADRPGHDLRYAIDSSKARKELAWSPSRDFDEGLANTVAWYFDHEPWWRPFRA